MEAVIPALAVTVIIAAPLLHGFLSFSFVENILVRLLMVIAVVLAVRKGPMEGLLVALAVMTLIIERNQDVLSRLPNQQPQWPSNNPGMPVQAAPLVGVAETVSYVPRAFTNPPVQPIEGSTADNKFETAGGLRDSIPRLPAAPLTNAAQSFYKGKGLAN